MSPENPSEGTLTRASSVTIAKIAEEAGVSVPTVSKVLNGRADVAAATRARVESIIRKHGYRRRSRAGARVGMLDLVFDELDSTCALEVIRGVEHVARAEGLSVVLSEIGRDRAAGPSWVDSVLIRRPVGVVLAFSAVDPAQRAQLRARSIPFVAVDPLDDPGEDVPAVGSANWNGGLTATRHLIQLGHRRIGVISGTATALCTRARLDGYRAALDTADLEVDPTLVRAGRFDVESGRREGFALLALPERPTAIFAGNDLQALGLYSAARDLGLRIPEDLSVVGYDDVPIAGWVGPALTTVHQPLSEMAQAATRMVIALSRGEQPAHLRLDLATRLVVRESTAPPAGA